MSTISRILSGKDGVGKSTVTALVGEQLALMGKKVLLIEFENGLRCLDLFVGAMATKVYDLDDVLKAYLNGELNDSQESCNHHDCNNHEEKPVYVIPSFKQ